MHEGQLQQYGPPREVYTRPANRTVADFMGLVNLIPARVRRVGIGRRSRARRRAPRRRSRCLRGVTESAAVQMAVRPENLRVTALVPGVALGPGVVPGTIAELTFLGNLVDCHVTLDDATRLRVQVDPGQRLEIGLRVGVQIDAATVFP